MNLDEFREKATAAVGLEPDAPMESTLKRIGKLSARGSAAFTERNRVVALLCSLYPSVRMRTAIKGWDPEWHGCVFVQLPTGQASWHYHDSDAELFAHVPEGAAQWDGHTTPEKYARVARLAALKPEHTMLAPAAEAAAKPKFACLKCGAATEPAWIFEGEYRHFIGVCSCGMRSVFAGHRDVTPEKRAQWEAEAAAPAGEVAKLRAALARLVDAVTDRCGGLDAPALGEAWLLAGAALAAGAEGE